MKIEASPALGDGTNNVSFFIDDMVTPIFTHNSVMSRGYNVVEFNTNYGSTSGYFDDASFGTIPEPGSLVALAVGLVSLAGIRRRRS